MTDDEQAIRELVTTWLAATADGDLAEVLRLMADDIVFLLPGQPPMRGKDAFAAGFQTALQQVRIDSKSEVQEIQISGNLAYCWNHLSVTMTPRLGGMAKRRSGYTLTILRKEPAGNWVVWRDANLLSAC